LILANSGQAVKMGFVERLRINYFIIDKDTYSIVKEKAKRRADYVPA